MSAAKKIVLNTAFLYIKMLISMFVGLYSTRIVLNALGVEDFGLFNLIAGVVAMLSFLNAAMSASTQRYMSYYLGSGFSNKLKSVFNSSVLLHLFIGFIIVIGLELCGLFLFDGFLNIPEDRISTAKIIFHFMVLSTFFTINAVPYDAAINAHENMLFDSIVGIVDVVFRLGIAIYLMYTGFDKLIVYGLLMAVLTIVVRLVKSIYCIRKYEECSGKLTFRVDVSLLKEMFSFAGWNMFGALCGLGRSQGMAIILNLFFGTVVNAAYGIANQVNAQLYSFSANMLKALNPQIVKSEGGGDRNRMLRLAMLASKCSFFLLSFFAIPLIFEMPYVLTLWLKNVPEYTVIFCQLVLVGTLTNQITIGLQTAIQSTGKIKLYQSVVGSLLLLNLPVAYFLLKWGFPAYYALISFIVIEVVSCGFRIYFLHKITGMSILEYIRKVILKILLPIIPVVVVCFIPYTYLQQSFLRLVMLVVLSILVYMTSIFFFGLEKNEQMKISDLFIKLKCKFHIGGLRHE